MIELTCRLVEDKSPSNYASWDSKLRHGHNVINSTRRWDAARFAGHVAFVSTHVR